MGTHLTWSSQVFEQSGGGAGAVDAIVLTLSCPDQRGIVHAVATFLLVHGCNITESQQHREADTARFFMRVTADREKAEANIEGLRAAFAATAATFQMTWYLGDAQDRPRVLLLGSRSEHCVSDLLFRWRTGWLPVEVIGLVSNHPNLEPLASWHGVPFHHLPVAPETKQEQEAAVLDIVERERVELVVLARYMQVLSEELCRQLNGRVINIHHSFLPSFKGAAPYRQAHVRGVKLIGATAHYVTPDLDEGPIIEQDVARADHRATVEELTATGRDVESQVLARAVRWHAERRVLLNGSRTVVFS